MPRTRTRAYASDTIALSIGVLSRQGALRPGALATCQWSGWSPVVVVVYLTEGELELHGDTARGDFWCQSVRYELGRCGAGERPWWLCPTCGRRCGELLLAVGRCGQERHRGAAGMGRRAAADRAARSTPPCPWACRGCQGIAYRSQSEASERRAWHGVVKAARRISPGTDPRSPERPPGMRRAYYDRLWAQWYTALRRWESEEEAIAWVRFLDMLVSDPALLEWFLSGAWKRDRRGLYSAE